MPKKKNQKPGTYSITNLERKVEDGYIIEATLTYKIESNEAMFSQNVSCTFSEDKGDDFIPFENVTEAEVIEWCLEQIPAEPLANMEEFVLREYTKIYNENTNPTIEEGFPSSWN